MVIELLKILLELILLTWILECTLFALYFLKCCIDTWRDRHGME